MKKLLAWLLTAALLPSIPVTAEETDWAQVFSNGLRMMKSLPVPNEGRKMTYDEASAACANLALNRMVRGGSSWCCYVIKAE